LQITLSDSPKPLSPPESLVFGNVRIYLRFSDINDGVMTILSDYD